MKFTSLLVEAMMYLIIDVDEEELMGGKLIYCIINFFVEEEICYLVCYQKYLDALEADVGMETKVMECLHIFILIWKEELILPSAPTGHAAPAVPASRVNQDTLIELCRSSTTTTSLANLAMQNFLTERTVSKERNTR
ncbi:uncharacterized protein LOC114263151 isoform X1 [Camellia sinensis]|uniref:uncharacterized protein LOC114263151 isoform X1 n=1 Tax=Camellia sinensis TaxID=4442 RepID=UPI001036AEFB|nr:uncharacterized protein LOC114263151 isoform X1 [Camellia sinensis]XP_028059446.1 uncharacterized protein LOC114263151 isoform X1 [Camellia sinensis]XP_028059447.1 uncharacterized protein LOC114263151 isoform X1 [Camellia sinensis]XP_028059448.1 uncharacterized protein LOC114263151 isoform X1 [Camellia sinensis]